MTSDLASNVEWSGTFFETQHSTGSSRFVMTGSDIVYATAPGTIHIQVDKGTKQDKMKKALIKAAKDEGLDYAYIRRSIAGTGIPYLQG